MKRIRPINFIIFFITYFILSFSSVESIYAEIIQLEGYDDFSDAAVLIDFDYYPDGTPIPNSVCVNTKFQEWGVTFASNDCILQNQPCVEMIQV